MTSPFDDVKKGESYLGRVILREIFCDIVLCVLFGHVVFIFILLWTCSIYFLFLLWTCIFSMCCGHGHGYLLYAYFFVFVYLLFMSCMNSSIL